MADAQGFPIRSQLSDRRTRLEKYLEESPGDEQLLHLLTEIDAALSRLDNGTYGLCEDCKGPIEPERLLTDPLAHYCLAHLTRDERTALEQDLKRAARIQAALLPRRGMESMGWETTYHYEGAGLVSGDYCDLLESGSDLYFILGDVSGKGIAASMLMTHLHATFRSLVALELPLERMMEMASRMFCMSTLPTHFATLICGTASDSGTVRICNAGHQPPVLIKGAKIESLEARGLPLGMFCDERFRFSEERLEPGDTIFLYTDGLVEAQDGSGREYGMDRLIGMVSDNRSLPPDDLVAAAVEDLGEFRSGAPMLDDLTIMAIRRL